MTEIATALGYKTASSYQRYEDDALFRDEYLPLKIVERLIPILASKGSPPITEQEVVALGGPLLQGHSNAPMIPIVGQVSAGMFQAVDDLTQEPIGYVPMAKDPRYAGRLHYALRVDGESMNKTLPNGSYAIVIEGWAQQPRTDDLAVVRQHRNGFVERTVKRVRITPDGIELVPESTDERFKSLKLSDDPDCTVEIEGYVIGNYKPF